MLDKHIDLKTEGYTAKVTKHEDGHGVTARVHNDEGVSLYASPILADEEAALDVCERWAAAHEERLVEIDRVKGVLASELVPWLQVTENQIQDYKEQKAALTARIRSIEEDRRDRIREANNPQVPFNFVVDPTAMEDGEDPDALDADPDEDLVDEVDAPDEDVSDEPKTAAVRPLPRKASFAIDAIAKCSDRNVLEAWAEREIAKSKVRPQVLEALDARLEGLQHKPTNGRDPSAVNWPAEAAQ